MKNKIKEGMVVRWRWIGGPKMTVKEVESKYVVVRWFVDDKLHETRIINTNNLEIVFCQHNLDLKNRI